MYFTRPLLNRRPKVSAAYHQEEASCVGERLTSLNFNETIEANIHALAMRLVTLVRQEEVSKTGMEAVMDHYDLSTEEGVMLMCLAEALLRVPDKQTENLLIRDKLTSADWEAHLGVSESSFVNLATWGLALTGKVLKKDDTAGNFKQLWQNLIRKSGEPVVRQAVREAIKVMSHQFVLGRTIEEALEKATELVEEGYTFSFDMLGEGARTQEDANTYFAAYLRAIGMLQESPETPLFKARSISVKLSALYPCYTFEHQETAVPFLVDRLKTLARAAKENHISLTVDAEESYRLEISLDIIEAVFSDPEFAGWEGLGLAVQAYQKRAYPVLEWLVELANKHGKRMQVRLVKGAYWDTEIKYAQMMGFNDYPVFTRKISTDVSYLACAKYLLAHQEAIYPQFATHNAYTVAAILTLMGDQIADTTFEFQHLQGMGRALHAQLLQHQNITITNRIYAPVGSHENLLPYLVRRLLENGANSSFVNQITDQKISIEQLIQSPVALTQSLMVISHPKIPLPVDLYETYRKNSMGIDLSDYHQLIQLEKAMQAHTQTVYGSKKHPHTITSPANRTHIVGYVEAMSPEKMLEALNQAAEAFVAWDERGVEARANLLNKMADTLEENRAELILLLALEAGRHLKDGISEVREAVDFCRYYAMQAQQQLQPNFLPGYTGETNALCLRGRGVMLCISPWNFPVAIFTGQIAAALVTGNCVLAKPAETTPLVAQKVVQLFHAAGVPKAVLQLVIGAGASIGKTLIPDERIAGILFTGSTAVAKIIQKQLAERKGPIVPFIAETGGINAMIADSTALPEQLVDDVIASAFGSAGQRCSALRVLFVQEEIADKVIAMLKGAMQELCVGDPLFLTTDVGPVIDAKSQQDLTDYIEIMKRSAQLIHEVELPPACEKGTFVAPVAFELAHLGLLTREVFGPVLHVIRYAKKDLAKVVDSINALNFGLTFGIQSRVNETVEWIASKIRAGNIYVNRNMIGAVVGVQPFGGARLSGTGPKAGGPHYLLRLCDEATITINTTASGGNASLMSLD